MASSITLLIISGSTSLWLLGLISTQRKENMPEVIFEPNSDLYTVDWGKYGAIGDYHDHVNYDDEGKHIYTMQEAAEWRDIRFGLSISGFDPTDRSFNFIKVQFRGFGIPYLSNYSKAKAIMRCGSGGSPPWFTDYGDIQNLPADHTDFEQIWNLNPRVRAPWEWIDIGELQIGISGLPYYHPLMGEWMAACCTRLKLLVDYNDWLTPPPEMGGFFL
jgi:hypothetical protein